MSRNSQKSGHSTVLQCLRMRMRAELLPVSSKSVNWTLISRQGMHARAIHSPYTYPYMRTHIRISLSIEVVSMRSRNVIRISLSSLIIQVKFKPHHTDSKIIPIGQTNITKTHLGCTIAIIHRAGI